MQDVIDFLREEVEKCQQIAKVAEPDMAPSWLQSAELFERAADFIEARQKGTTGANVTENVTTAPSRRESKKRYKPKNGTDRREEPQ